MQAPDTIAHGIEPCGLTFDANAGYQQTACAEPRLVGAADLRCIFHSRQENKDPAQIKQAIQAIAAGERKPNCVGWVFPVAVELKFLKLPYASFAYATFRDSVTFYQTEFEDHAVFHNAEFQGDATFTRATFRKGVWLRQAEFKGFAAFDLVTFAGEVRL